MVSVEEVPLEEERETLTKDATNEDHPKGEVEIDETADGEWKELMGGDLLMKVSLFV